MAQLRMCVRKERGKETGDKALRSTPEVVPFYVTMSPPQGLHHSQCHFGGPDAGLPWTIDFPRSLLVGRQC